MAEKRGPWSIVSAREAYDNRWIRVTHHDVITPSGDPGIYGTIHYKNRALGIVPVDAQQHTYLVGQYRFALNAYSWEIPEGGGPLDVDFLESAKRELLEETGLRARRWHKLFESDLSNSVNDERPLPSSPAISSRARRHRTRPRTSRCAACRSRKPSAWSRRAKSATPSASCRCRLSSCWR